MAAAGTATAAKGAAARAAEATMVGAEKGAATEAC